MAPQFGEPTGGGTEEPLTLETTVKETGHPQTVLRDNQGHLAYPGNVPEATTLPASSQPPFQSPPKAATGSTGSIPKWQHKGSKSTTHLPRRPARRNSGFPPGIKRTGTNISQLQHALWNENSYIAGAQAAGEKPHRVPQPSPYGHFRRFKVGNEEYKTKGRVSKRDGRLAISIKDISGRGYLANALGTALRKVVPTRESEDSEEKPARPATLGGSLETLLTPESIKCPRLNIVIMVIGSRGDIQPFLKMGKQLKEQYGHRVRIATHPAFRTFVEVDSGLEFFSVGGDPSELMAFMVKNPGMIPTLETVRAGDIGRRRVAMAEMFEGFWRACINATDDEKNAKNRRMMWENPPFVADFIIANPPSFAHVHCAEALGVPLVLAFTFPYTPTKSFPHPLAIIKKSNVDPGYTNFMSYPLVDMMVWQGLGDLVNDFRVKTLGLDPVSTLWAPGSLYRMKVPFTYLWSPSLVPKPPDWGDEIDVSGFVFLNLAASYTPPDPLKEFLAAGDAPIYIGFGSIVVDDANAFTDMIFEAVKLAGVRALVSKGWGGFGRDTVPDNIYMIGSVPHDWLFPQVRACVIHGGAGTSAMALKCGRPTVVVPFFGDQYFWGSMIAGAKAGPEPIPYKQLSAEKLAEGIKYCLTDEAREKAQALAAEIGLEGDGAKNACAFFHKHLKLSGKHSMRCSILPDKVAVWNLRDTSLRLSALAAEILVLKGYLNWRKLRPIRHCEWNDFDGPGEPVTGMLGSLGSSVADVFGGVASIPGRITKTSQKRRERKELRRRMLERQKNKLDAQDASKNKVARTPTLDRQVTADRGYFADGYFDGGSLRTATTDATADEGYLDNVGEGVGRSAAALASAPIDLAVALAQGFHNAPRLYGDDTVRRPTRVTGIRSGLRAARREFFYGIYDAWTGVVRLPVRGARKAGVEGFAKGVGMGATGLVLKNIAAIAGPLGYTLKGIEKQVERSRLPIKRICRARVLQGQHELHELSKKERDALTKEVIQGKRRRHSVGEAFESVPMAESTLKAVNRGETVHDAVEGYRRAHSVDSKWSSKTRREPKRAERSRPDSPKSLEKEPSQDRDSGKLSTVREPVSHVTSNVKLSSKDKPVSHGMVNGKLSTVDKPVEQDKETSAKAVSALLEKGKA
ncbi:hypothetical protein VPNG_00595 [Cytospora leucostoma]|uniref:Uncharacterized protein n=1 Tax=Cytospora leucostoma TaxID=1230097 RepID=A0A423XNL3_9PEZI|nr:hypothetical protein VPNG_00595 [Cytospora leucostoma]